MSIKIALLLPGHMRSWRQCMDGWEKHLFSKYNVDVFVNTWDRAPSYDLFQDKVHDIQSIIDAYKQAGAKHVSVNIEKAKNMDKIPGISSSKVYKYWNQTDDEDKKICHRQLIYQQYKVNQCNNDQKRYAVENNVNYDIVIRSRPDFIFKDEPTWIRVNTYITMFLTTPNPVSQPLSIHHDIFWFGPPELMDKFSNMFHHLGDMCEKIPDKMRHNHYLYYFYLNEYKIQYTDVYAQMSIQRHPNYTPEIPMIVEDYDTQ
jgi:hypothetical protein